MSRREFVFTSESVSEGHPDKVCDRVSDTIVDLIYQEAIDRGFDTGAVRVACETAATTNRVALLGEVRCPDGFNVETDSAARDKVEAAVRNAVKDIGYEQDGFHWKNFDFSNFLHGQSAHIAQGVDAGDSKEEGAGDQGIMFGYANQDTDVLMPAPIHYSHKILERLAEVRKDGTEPTLEPDAKSQVTVAYEGGKPVGVTSIVLSTQHSDESQTSADIRAIVEPYIREVLPAEWITDGTVWHINPTGKFVIGGPDGDCGLTGRKIIVDTYGGYAPHGGGAFSGKDSTKVDRSAAYAARYLAKNVVAAGIAPWCSIQLSYAIGVAQPLSIYVDMGGSGEVSEEALEKALGQVMDLSPTGIRKHLDLNKPIYARTSAYGHFGRAPDADGGFSWEKTDLIDALKKAL